MRLGEPQNTKEADHGAFQTKSGSAQRNTSIHISDGSERTDQRRKEIQNHWFLAVFFPLFLSLLKEMGPSETERFREALSRLGRGDLPGYAEYDAHFHQLQAQCRAAIAEEG